MSDRGGGGPWVLAIGHGTRDTAGTSQFLQVIELLRAMRPNASIEPCFLEMQSPSISQAFAQLASRGARSITALPLLLSLAGHARHDIPRALEAASQAANQLPFRQLEPLRSDPAAISVSIERYVEATARSPAADAKTALVLIGRGGDDDQAAREFAQFAKLRQRARPAGWSLVAFLAKARPSLAEALGRAADLPCERIVLQPHLLFEGALMNQVRDHAAAFAREHPELPTLATACLGPHPALAQAFAHRLDAAIHVGDAVA